MMNQEVRRIMYKNPQTVSPTQNVVEVSHFMIENNIQHMPVIEEGKVVGLVTSVDLWKQYENNATLQHLNIGDVMDTKILKLSPKDKVGTAAELLAARRFGTLLVVNLANELKGIVTSFDIVKDVFNEEYKEAILFKKEFQMN